MTAILVIAVWLVAVSALLAFLNGATEGDDNVE